MPARLPDASRPARPRPGRPGRVGRRARAGAVAVAGLAALACAVVYGGTARGRPRATGPVDHLTVATTAYVGNCSIVVAEANAYFAAEGLSVTRRPAPTGRAALAAVVARRADVATVADVPIVFATLARQPVAVIATISTGARDHGVVGRRDGGIASPRDLRGKRIAVPRGTSAHFFLDAFLNRQLLSPADVTLLDLPPEQLSAALASGRADAIAIWQPFVAAAADALGANASVFHGDGVYDVMYNLAVAADAVPARRGALEKLLRALARGAADCERRPREAQRVVARAFGLDASRVRELWPSYGFRVGLHQALLAALEDETRWAIRNRLGAAAGGYNYLDRLYLEPLRAVAPASVTVIH